MSSFSPEQVRRYSRHVLLPDVGGIGQARLLAATVSVDASGAAGRVAAAYLVAAGVGTVTIDDGCARRVTAAAGFPLRPADVGGPLGAAVVAALGGRNPDARVVVGAPPADGFRLVIDGDADRLPLADAFALGGAAAAVLLHHIAIGARP